MKHFVAVFLLCLLPILSGCRMEEDPGEDEIWLPAVEEQKPEEPAEKLPEAFTLPYLSGQTLDPVTCIDGAQQAVASLLYEGLFRLDAQFQPEGVLCTEYTLSEDGLTYTFTLRTDAAFSDGSFLTASDVLATYRRAETSARYAARFANVASMRVSGKSKLILTLYAPQSALPALLDIPIVQSRTEKNAVPAGTGPYLYATDSGGAYLLANPNWWKGAVQPLPEIRLISAKDNDTAAYLFASGSVSLLVADLTGDFPLGADISADMTECPTAVMYYLGFNALREATADPALRSAIGCACERDTLADVYFAGHAQPSQFPVSPVSPLYPAELEEEPSLIGYQQSLFEAGVTASSPCELTLLVNTEDSFKLAAAEYLAGQLTADSMTVTLRALPWAEYLAALETGDFDLYMGTVRLCADWNTEVLIGAEGALNYGGYQNEELTALLHAFLADETEASALDFLRLFREEMPFAPLAFRNASLLTQVGLVHSLCPAPSNPFYGFEQWELAELG